MENEEQSPASIFITRQEVIKILNISMPTFERMVARGEFIRPFQFSKGVQRYNRSEVEQWIATKRRVNNTPRN